MAAGGRALARGVPVGCRPARLECCAGSCCGRAADIGADHGYLGISLLLNGRAEFVHASELREQPLRRAMENALRFGVVDRMRFSRADGLDAVDPDEVDTIVCAGMGGDLIAQILDRCRWVRDPRYTLILQPQSSGNDLRRKLARMGLPLSRSALRDGGFLYQAMAARFGNAAPVTPGQGMSPRPCSPAIRCCRIILTGSSRRWSAPSRACGAAASLNACTIMKLRCGSCAK
ncbi:MAG: class I SAM-dependent methyltransferase [Oscillospiraceae bacterium]